MDEMLSNYTVLDLRYLYERTTQYENIETNPFNLADINSNYYDVNDILPDKFSHDTYKDSHQNLINFKHYCQSSLMHMWKLTIYYSIYYSVM